MKVGLLCGFLILISSSLGGWFLSIAVHKANEDDRLHELVVEMELLRIAGQKLLDKIGLAEFAAIQPSGEGITQEYYRSLIQRGILDEDQLSFRERDGALQFLEIFEIRIRVDEGGALQIYLTPNRIRDSANTLA